MLHRNKAVTGPLPRPGANRRPTMRNFEASAFGAAVMVAQALVVAAIFAA